MKALELTVYPKLERPLYGHQIEGYRQQVKAEVALKEAKRLTDAELAAEYHAADVAFQRNIWQEMSRGEDWPDETWDRLAHPVNTLHHFATRPHYDEAP